MNLTYYRTSANDGNTDIQLALNISLPAVRLGQLKVLQKHSGKLDRVSF
ncbi:hypothetical protein HMPREF1144_0316 [Klebsiella sp. OBRC7]|nr:hypothetical protein HMPREF1144_0316 [Klebsiella sp. OBRC7]